MNLNGHASKLRQIATPIQAYDDAITLWFLPYRPALQSVLYQQLIGVLDDATLRQFGAIFVVLDSCLIDIEVNSVDVPEAMAIATYWECREGNSPAINFEIFTQVLTNDIMDTLWQCYEETRAKLPEAPKETQESTPPKDSPLEENGSPVKKGKRGKKRTKATS